MGVFAGRRYKINVYESISNSDGMGGRMGAYNQLVFSTRGEVVSIDPSRRFAYGDLVDKNAYEIIIRRRSELKPFHSIEIEKLGLKLKIQTIKNARKNNMILYDRFQTIVAYEG